MANSRYFALNHFGTGASIVTVASLSYVADAVVSKRNVSTKPELVRLYVLDSESTLGLGLILALSWTFARSSRNGAQICDEGYVLCSGLIADWSAYTKNAERNPSCKPG